MKPPKIELALDSGPGERSVGEFSYGRHNVTAMCSSKTRAYVFATTWAGRVLVAYVDFAGGETPAERIAVMDNVVALCEARRGT